ncbi:MAG: hypothetical protein A3D31_04940 [Candidatus Fluviicola riflensis]|nr:MAG: hypothetical protein CHH17_10080 [Candidatus Fluviicola riflensis]OGS79321.1 MAG: hypothetical protein A3D31_04940 [Candidatus Fluviicola riflensis]OGS86753.1 MAG: hypothetical protein A2724_04400 [Fluviicola sp. RIFCSPHIGHO2_01_FULL_43_53]OGS88773.1 MAG: hypothetical protein A3E30_00260 [Fluviicola sp. RIFCSPHIGHO2_12_FULL_43_24]
MPEAELITVKEFQDRELLGDYVDLFEKAEIPFSVEDSKPRFDATFANDESRRYYRINVAPVDLQNALELCGRMDEKIMKELPDDYYLFQFSDKELREILVRSFEWNSLDVMLAKKLLTERGVPFSEEKIAEERQEITDELDAPEKENTLIVVCGYIFCVFGGLLGLMLALLILNSKKTTHDGHRVPRYNAATRGHARNMLLIFIVVIILTLFFVGAQLG